MRKFQLLFLSLSVGIVLAGAPAQAGPAEDQAVSAANTFLALVDAGKLDDAYSQMALIAKKAASKDQFKGPVGATRTKVGKVLSRTLVSKKAEHNPPGAPPGDYVVLEYSTRFATKGASVERVTPMKDTDGSWRVAGYFIVK